jgi:hypothetical protein
MDFAKFMDSLGAYGDRSFPDAAFIVEHGTPKDDKGRTLQQGRKLPHHNKNVTDPNDNGSVDIPHLRNALARVGQVKTQYEDRTSFIKRARAHLEKHAKALLKTHKQDADIFPPILRHDRSIWMQAHRILYINNV